MRDLARYECLERHAAHQTLMAPLPERAPSVLSASGTFLIVPRDADAAPAPASAYLPRSCVVFIRSLCNTYDIMTTVYLLLIQSLVVIS